MTKRMAPFFEAHAPKSEAEIAAFLRRNGIPDVKPGRPRAGSRPSSVIHVRLPDEVQERLRRKARRKHLEPSKVIRLLCTEWALS